MTATHPPTDLRLETPFPGLHAFPPAPLPFGRSIESRAFLLERDHGNVLVYSAGTVAPAAQAAELLGGVSWQYLGHWHEAMFGTGEINAAFGAPVVVHEADADETAATAGVEPVTFAGRHALGEGFELVPVPGHTPGSVAYLWEHGDHRFLFTADTVYLDGDEWVGAMLPSSDRAAYLDSLELLLDLDFDVLVPWIATAGEPYAAVTDRAGARRRIAAIADRVRRGESR